MKRKMMAILLALVMTVSLVACGEGEETTLTGMVVAVDGTKITLMEMDSANMGSMNFSGIDQFQMPEGMEGFQGFGNFDPEDFTMPEGGNMPQWGSGEMPEDFTMPEGVTIPEGMEGMMPGNGNMPSFGGNGGMPNFGGDGSMPSFGGNGNMPSFGGNGSARPDSGSESGKTDVETKTVDLAKAHISVEIDGGKESGSMSNIKAGTFVTITINGKGEATYVLVSPQSFFGGGNRRPTN